MDQFSQDSGLVTRAGTDLKDAIIFSQFKGLGHLSHNIRLGYGLAFSDGKGKISVRLVLQCLTDKKVARNLSHRFEHPLIIDTTGLDLGTYHLFPEASKFHI